MQHLGKDCFAGQRSQHWFVCLSGLLAALLKKFMKGFWWYLSNCPLRAILKILSKFIHNFLRNIVNKTDKQTSKPVWNNKSTTGGFRSTYHSVIFVPKAAKNPKILKLSSYALHRARPPMMGMRDNCVLNPKHMEKKMLEHYALQWRIRWENKLTCWPESST